MLSVGYEFRYIVLPISDDAAGYTLFIFILGGRFGRTPVSLCLGSPITKLTECSLC